MMDDDIPPHLIEELTALREDETPVVVHLTRWHLWCLMSTVQLASRHPAAAETLPIQIAVEVARQIQPIAAPTPALAEVAAMGWDMTQDRQ
jgi:hypothetical protein